MPTPQPHRRLVALWARRGPADGAAGAGYLPGPGGSRGVGVRTPVPDVTTALLAADLMTEKRARSQKRTTRGTTTELSPQVRT